jgi:hypothetical protein
VSLTTWPRPQAIFPAGASRDILAPDPRAMPVVLLARRRARPPLRAEARPAVLRRRPRAWPQDRHKLDQSRQSEQPVPALLQGRRGRRQEGRDDRHIPRTVGRQAARERGRAVDARHRRHPGPAGAPYVYGHVFVVLALLVAHPAWGVIALPLLARLYVRKKDLPGIDPKHRPPFRTKLELAVELLQWARPWLGLLGKPPWVVADGA